MPNYVYQCTAGHEMELFRYLADYTPTTRCVCGKSAAIVPQACAIATVGTFSRSIDDHDVRASMACDGSYLDPTLSFDPETQKVIAPITSEKQRQQLMEARGLVELPPSDKAKDVQLAKKRKRKIYTGSGSRA